MCNRLFRVEASIGLTSEHTYIFSIDGVKFIDMPRKPVSSGVGSKAKPFSSGGGNNSEDRTEQHRRTVTTGSIPNSSRNNNNLQSPFANPPRSSFNSNNNDNSFDPFADQSKGTAAFDPFGTAPPGGGGSATKSGTPSSTAGRPAARPTPPAHSKSFSQQSHATQSTATSLFGNFDDNDSSTHSGASHSTAGFGAAPQQSLAFDPFGNDSSHGAAADPFATHAPQVHIAPPQKKLEPKRSSLGGAAPVVDLFDSSPAAPVPRTVSPAAKGADDFFSSSSNGQQPAAGGKIQRRNSAQEISMDFAGLSFTTPAPQNPAPKSPEVVVPVPPQPEPETQPETNGATKDPWGAAKNLVDLDLSGRGAAAHRQAARASVTQGPTLDNLLGVPGSGGMGGRRASFNSTAMPVDPFAQPPQPAMGFGGANSTSFYGAGGMGQPGMVGGGQMMPGAPVAPAYGRGLGSGPAVQPPLNPFTAHQQQQQPVQGVMGGRGSMGGMSVGAGGYSGYQAPGSQQQQQQQPAKSSLDTLNWNM